jgi:hypothetical protein
MNECIVAHNALQDIVIAIALESEAHVQREVSHLSLATLDDEWISLSPKTIFGLAGRSHC